MGASVFADAIINRNIHKKNSAIQSSSIIYSNFDSNYDEESFSIAIKEVKDKIRLSPNDYILYASLVDLYIKSRDYDKAYEELVFLVNLSKQNKLNATLKNYITNVYNQNKTTLKYSKNKGMLYLNFALIALIIDDKSLAETCINKASNYSLASDHIKGAFL